MGEKKVLTPEEEKQRLIKKAKKMEKEKRRNRRKARKLQMDFKKGESHVVLKSIAGDQLLRETLQANPRMRLDGKKRKKDGSSSASRSPTPERGSSYSSSISSSSSSISSSSSSASSEARKMAKEMATGPGPSFAFERPIPIKPADEMSLMPTRAGVGMGGAMGASLAAMGPAATDAEIEAFIVASLVDPFAAAKLRGLNPGLQKQVIAKGPISGVKNPSSVLLARVRDAEMGVLQANEKPNVASMGMTPMMFKKCDDPEIEALITKYKLDMRAAGMLRSLPRDERRVALTIDLEQTRDPSQFIIQSLASGHKLTGQTPWQARDASSVMANFGGGRGNEGADKGRL